LVTAPTIASNVSSQTAISLLREHRKVLVHISFDQENKAKSRCSPITMTSGSYLEKLSLNGGSIGSVKVSDSFAWNWASE
jgi:hypothetical protein